MSDDTQSRWRRNRWIWLAALCGAAMGIWYAAASWLTGGVVDIAVFAPPSAILGLGATWAAHVFVPHRFSWRRGLLGLLCAAVFFSPLMAAFVTFAAAWDPASFLALFTVGAWFAFASGLVTATFVSAVRLAIRWWRRRAAPTGRGRWVVSDGRRKAWRTRFIPRHYRTTVQGRTP